MQFILLPNFGHFTPMKPPTFQFFFLVLRLPGKDGIRQHTKDSLLPRTNITLNSSFVITLCTDSGSDCTISHFVQLELH
jgi:hypothetical protein